MVERSEYDGVKIGIGRGAKWKEVTPMARRALIGMANVGETEQLKTSVEKKGKFRDRVLVHVATWHLLYRLI